MSDILVSRDKNKMRVRERGEGGGGGEGRNSGLGGALLPCSLSTIFKSGLCQGGTTRSHSLATSIVLSVVPVLCNLEIWAHELLHIPKRAQNPIVLVPHHCRQGKLGSHGTRQPALLRLDFTSAQDRQQKQKQKTDEKERENTVGEREFHGALLS